jgi:hypothetical protein
LVLEFEVPLPASLEQQEMKVANAQPCNRSSARAPVAWGGKDASTGHLVGRLRMRIGRVALVASMVVLVAACSSLRLGYNNADTLALYSLDSYFDLDDAQETLAKERVRALLAWHRSTQLADYARLIDTAQAQLDAPLSADDVLAIQAQVNERMMVVAKQAAPELAQLARTLTPEQLDHFSSKLARDNAKLRRQTVQAGGAGDLEAVREERIKRSTKRAETWLGGLTAEQEQLLRDATARRPAGQQQWLDERERRQREFTAVLERIRTEQLDATAGGALLERYFTELALPSDPARRARVQASRRANAEVIAQLLNLATPAQKDRMLKKLRDYASDFTVLASEGARG